MVEGTEIKLKLSTTDRTCNSLVIRGATAVAAAEPAAAVVRKAGHGNVVKSFCAREKKSIFLMSAISSRLYH
jgi:hypothetical protein